MEWLTHLQRQKSLGDFILTQIAPSCCHDLLVPMWLKKLLSFSQKYQSQRKTEHCRVGTDSMCFKVACLVWVVLYAWICQLGFYPIAFPSLSTRQMNKRQTVCKQIGRECQTARYGLVPNKSFWVLSDFGSSSRERIVILETLCKNMSHRVKHALSE